MKPRLLVACEKSRRVASAFEKKGWEAWSCDILPAEVEGNHIQDDVLKYLAGLHLCPECGKPCPSDFNSFQCLSCEELWPLDYPHEYYPWDMAICHPPCTYLANSGLHYLSTSITRQGELDKAAKFVIDLWTAPIPRIAIENPIGWLNTHWRKPDQIIQPYYFGEHELKTTCLWLKALPPLMATLICETPKPNGHCIRQSGRNKGKQYNYYYRQGKTAEARSRTFECIAKAMAEQWGTLPKFESSPVHKGEK